MTHTPLLPHFPFSDERVSRSTVMQQRQQQTYSRYFQAKGKPDRGSQDNDKVFKDNRAQSAKEKGVSSKPNRAHSEKGKTKKEKKEEEWEEEGKRDPGSKGAKPSGRLSAAGMELEN
jgi:hypothetical protein